jgi:hypothetical protein
MALKQVYLLTKTEKINHKMIYVVTELSLIENETV